MIESDSNPFIAYVLCDYLLKRDYWLLSRMLPPMFWPQLQAAAAAAAPPSFNFICLCGGARAGCYGLFLAHSRG